MISRQALTGIIGGRYAIERELGYGATSQVYLARDLLNEGLVALKVLREEFAESIGAERFLREIRLIGTLEHPAIVGLLDSGVHQSRPFYILPYMKGGTLRERLQADRQLPVSEVVAIGVRIAEALDFAHQRSLIHRDVKPENILFHEGKAYLADFGIARAMERLTGDITTTSTGVVRGTPAYMSPEQAAGEQNIDGRSDIYSLACVLYEAVAGVPAFVGPTAQSILQQRIVHTPRELSVYRPTVPVALEQVLHRAFATSAADRWQTAGEFGSALQSAGGDLPLPVQSSEEVRALRRRSKRIRYFAVGGALTAAVASAAALKSRDRSASALASADTTRIAVFPFRAPPGTDGAPVQYGLMSAIARWSGVSVADRFRLDEATRGRADLSDREVRRTAVELKSGRYVQGEIRPTPGGWSVYAALYDVKDGRLHDITATVGSVADTAALRTVADSLLLRGARWSDPAMRSLPAIQSMVVGRRALDEWDLAGADSAFARARSVDPSAPQPRLWRAQVRQWSDQSPSAWMEDAITAATDSLGLLPVERSMAAGLVGLARRDFPSACAAYRRVIAMDSNSFAGWFGLGECQRADPVVLPDRRSPSGWRFRGSYQSALNAYLRAFDVLPVTYRAFQGNAFARLGRLLRTSSTSFRGGGSGFPPPFFGRLIIEGDSLLDVPMPSGKVTAGISAVSPAANVRATERLRALFFDVAARWSAAFPTSAEAKEAIAISLEMQGDESAVDSLAAAAQLAAPGPLRLHLAVERVLVAAKLSIPADSAGLARAQYLADSIIRQTPDSEPVNAKELAPLAALLGRCDLVAVLLRRSAGPMRASVRVPTALVGETQATLATTAMGCPPSQSVSTVDQLADRIRQAVPDSARLGTESTLLGEAVALNPAADSIWLLRLAPNDFVLRALLEVRRRRAAEGVAIVARREAARHQVQPGAYGPNAALPVARVYLAAGDTIAAARLLDEVLQDTRNRAPVAAGDAAQLVTWIGTLGTAARLRGELAAGDPAARTRWGQVGRALSPRSH